jgi:hypothetical protein
MIEVGIAQLDRLAVQQWLAAAAADRIVTQPGGGNAVGRRAMGAGDMRAGALIHGLEMGAPALISRGGIIDTTAT